LDKWTIQSERAVYSQDVAATSWSRIRGQSCWSAARL